MVFKLVVLGCLLISLNGCFKDAAEKAIDFSKAKQEESIQDAKP